MNKKRYWMVQVEGKGVPAKQHPTEASAIDEAERLAGINPERAVFVLESVLAYQVQQPPALPVPLV